MADDRFPTTPYGELPPVMRVLDISDTDSSASKLTNADATWLEECLANDSAIAVKLEPATLEAAMTLLRQEVFDVVIVHHQPGRFDAVSALAPIRAASPDFLAVVVVGEAPESEMSAICLEASADAYFCRGQTDVRTLLWGLARAAERQRLLSESQEYRQAKKQWQTGQHQEAVHQLRSLRSLLVDHLGPEDDVDPTPPSWLVDCFANLLHIYVVSGSGNLRTEVGQLTERLTRSEVTLAEALTAYTMAAEDLVRGLGSRTAWHILGRGNLLTCELIMQMQSGRVVN